MAGTACSACLIWSVVQCVFTKVSDAGRHRHACKPLCYSFMAMCKLLKQLQ